MFSGLTLCTGQPIDVLSSGRVTLPTSSITQVSVVLSVGRRHRGLFPVQCVMCVMLFCSAHISKTFQVCVWPFLMLGCQALFPQTVKLLKLRGCGNAMNHIEVGSSPEFHCMCFCLIILIIVSIYCFTVCLLFHLFIHSFTEQHHFKIPTQTQK